LDLIDPKQWSIENWTKDVSEELGRRVKSDSNPDYTIKHLKSARKFSIECKYHGHLYDKIPGIRWAKEYQILNYNRFENEEKHPVYVVIFS
ncbi:MAG: hypothetical protein Q8O41_10785, partial [Candidatus Methanoperedens sp.]|nr:hypothetical protein [Candidatus Methanoperedens sp.]